MPGIIDVKTGAVMKITGLGMDFELRENSYLFDDFLVSSKLLDQTEKVRYVTNITKNTMQLSSAESALYYSFDLAYSDELAWLKSAAYLYTTKVLLLPG